MHKGLDEFMHKLDVVFNRLVIALVVVGGLIGSSLIGIFATSGPQIARRELHLVASASSSRWCSGCGCYGACSAPAGCRRLSQAALLARSRDVTGPLSGAEALRRLRRDPDAIVALYDPSSTSPGSRRTRVTAARARAARRRPCRSAQGCSGVHRTCGFSAAASRTSARVRSPSRRPTAVRSSARLARAVSTSPRCRGRGTARRRIGTPCSSRSGQTARGSARHASAPAERIRHAKTCAARLRRLGDASRSRVAAACIWLAVETSAQICEKRHLAAWGRRR